ncbi:MAG: TIGR01906 family membrane protein [Bacillota bacterium]
MIVKKILMSFAAAVFVLSSLLFLLFTDVQLVAFDRSYYVKQYEKYEVPSRLSMTMEELMNSTEKLLLYMEGRRDNLDFKAFMGGEEREFFSQRDKLHMVDVKELFSKGRLLRNLAAAYMVIFVLLFFSFKKSSKAIGRFGIWLSCTGLLPVLVLILLMYSDFNRYFTIFHEIFFTNDLWLLDPKADTLVNIFPESFFADTAYRIGCLYILELVVIFSCSIIYILYKKRKYRGNVQ